MDRSIILLQAVEVVKSFGYKCFFPRYYTLQKQPTYCFITDGTNIGYMQANEFGYGICFSTIHKPNKKHGNGLPCFLHVCNQPLRYSSSARASWSGQDVPRGPH